MSETKFMHGPWHFAGDGIIANDDDEEIGLSTLYDDEPNGRLVIVAPEMFEALAIFLDAYDHGLITLPKTGLEIARAALRNAGVK